ncbi:MAG: hypothetical protein KGZ51_03180 [Erysipelothrix sp.]|jgi:hypothetical protein|nr:hypothetical protein [Erysipelothrix sp.]
MEIISIIIDQIKNKDYDSAFYYVGGVFVLVFPSMVYLVLYDFELVTRLSFPVLLLLAIVYNVVGLILVLLLVYEFQSTFYIAKARHERKRIDEISKIVDKLERLSEVEILNNQESSEVSVINEDLSNKKTQVIDLLKRQTETVSNLLDEFIIAVYSNSILLGFNITFVIILFWTLKVDLKQILSTINYSHLIIISFLLSSILSLYKTFKFNKLNEDYKIKYKPRIIFVIFLSSLLILFNINL